MGIYVENVEDILEKLFEYFNVVNAAELSEKINTSQKTISNWKVRNSINAVKKKCRELGIYNQIFGEIHSNINNFTSANINKAFDLSSNSHSRDTMNINNDQVCEQILKMNKTIVTSFINVYNKLEKEGNLKKLHKIFGDLEFE